MSVKLISGGMQLKELNATMCEWLAILMIVEISQYQ